MKRLALFSLKDRKGAHGAAHRSQALLEFALALPILLLLLFGIIDLAALFQAWLTVENIARQTVRYAVTGQYDPAFCVDGPDAGGEACKGDGYEDEQDAARLLSVKAYADRQTVALFFTPGAAQNEIGHLNVVICSSRDVNDPPDGISDFTFFPSSTKEYAACQKDGAPAEDAGAPGDRVFIAVDFNHPYITPIFNQVWPMTHLFSHREGLVEMFRVPRLIAVPPDLPTPTSFNTVPPPSPSSTPTITNTPEPIYIEIVNPNPSGLVVTNDSQTRFDAIAWNPPFGTTNGDGILNVAFWFQGPGAIPGRNDNKTAYCAFGGNGPCDTMANVVDFTALPGGTYTIYAQAIGVDGRTSAIASKTFVLQKPPTATPTITLTPTSTPLPNCDNVFISGMDVRNGDSTSDLRVTVRNNNLVPGILTSSKMTWSSMYSPPLYWDFFWFLNPQAANRYHNPTGIFYDTTNPTISWANPLGAPAPLAGLAKTIWGARFDRDGAPALSGTFSVWLTFYFEGLGECAVSSSLVQPTPTATPLVSNTPRPTRTQSPITVTPFSTFTPFKTPVGPTITQPPTKIVTVPVITATASKTPKPPPTPTTCFDC